MRSRVVLPQPDGPTMLTNSPASTCSEMQARARVGGPPLVAIASYWRSICSAISRGTRVGSGAVGGGGVPAGRGAALAGR
jgi:hypothetical protein